MTACIEWEMGTDHNGYGKLWSADAGGSVYAHRVMYELVYGPTPEGKPFVLHSCDNPPCVNPLHLRAGDARDNALDQIARGRHHNANKTSCKNGHEFTAENTYWHSGGTKRACRACRSALNRARYLASK